MKELYMAPEVEILCFAPFEDLASDGWGFGGGQLPGTASDPIINTLPGNEEDGE